MSRPRLPHSDVTAGAAYHNKKKGSPVEEVRCGKCHRLLAKASYSRLQIKCPRCGAINDLRAVEPPTRAPLSAGAKEASNGAKTSKGIREERV